MHNALGLDEKLFLLKADAISANTNMIKYATQLPDCLLKQRQLSNS